MYQGTRYTSNTHQKGGIRTRRHITLHRATSLSPLCSGVSWCLSEKRVDNSRSLSRVLLVEIGQVQLIFAALDKVDVVGG